MASQSANNGASQSAGSKSVTFTRQAAQRIAKAVRTVESGNRNQPGIVFDHPQPQPPAKTFRMATFTGSWSLNATKPVFPLNVTASTSTFSVLNVLFEIPQLSDNTNSATVCAVAKDGTAWYLLNVLHTEAEVLTDVELLPTRLQFDRRRLVSINASISTAAIAITECSDNVATVEQLSVFFR